MNYAHNNYHLNNLLTHFNYVYPSSYTQVLNAFQSSADEASLDVDQVNDSSESNIDYINSLVSKDLRLTNPLKLRSTAKNAIVTYNALQKVFHSRYDDGRSN